MSTFQAATLNSALMSSGIHWPRRGTIMFPPTRAIRNIAAAPTARPSARKVNTGTSLTASFIIGQLKPQPSVKMTSSAQVERGK